jgi:hypothetical protein
MPENLTPRQLKTVELLVSCGDVTEAAKQARVSRDTVYRWMHQPAFRAALNRAIETAVSDLSLGLVSLGSKARSVLAEMLDDTTVMPAARIRAADIVFSRLIQLRELTTVEARLTALEAAQDVNKHK